MSCVTCFCFWCPGARENLFEVWPRAGRLRTAGAEIAADVQVPLRPPGPLEAPKLDFCQGMPKPGSQAPGMPWTKSASSKEAVVEFPDKVPASCTYIRIQLL